MVRADNVTWDVAVTGGGSQGDIRPLEKVREGNYILPQQCRERDIMNGGGENCRPMSYHAACSATFSHIGRHAMHGRLAGQAELQGCRHDNSLGKNCEEWQR